ncbi:MAG: hypothetical protein ER33_15145 [Cyanobium sp. CACIAM 14]|nr:MAG: hypothetical protein ER33_15145 [Cyanobium sp. CACIAM 14]
MPCPAAAGWQPVAQMRLPRRDREGAAWGGFSAASYQAEGDALWLLSDAPQGSLSLWRGLRSLGALPLQPVFRVTLQSSKAATLPRQMDGEGLVLRGQRAWVASEGRRSAERPAQLLAFEARSGRLLQALPLPQDWQPGEGRGLESNQGPESLALLRRRGEPDVLLMAAERPLRQDPRGQVRVLGWSSLDGAPVARPLASLAIPPEPGWGLSDLLVLDGATGPMGLLALLRRHDPPDRWQALLALYPLPAPVASLPATAPLQPLIRWDLIAAGLPADNWEALTTGPRLADGRPSLVLLSDDNFSPLQDNHLALLAPARPGPCSPRR